MSNIKRFDPFADLFPLDPFGEDFFKGFSLRPVFSKMESEPRMRLDVSESDGNYVVKAEIPGVRKEDVKVSVDGRQVSISAELKKEKEEKDNGKVIRSERYYGSAMRSFTLGEEVDEDRASARCEDGVLVLTLPKKPGTKSKQLTIG
ncbi:MAG: Hsp20/alpha crystallin family protein [Methyloversatilis sp.]|jgi:HSP20 family protein|nr:Hsp20/alpha crystallin family protein [Methyloversatilis sp.]MBP6193281.1 Hsp20/alpha crystallin family protein [Methyloversatilis sp.]MBP9117240.1 Hsp20/alpha crystallin family protein [Methyloversatilis sp.]